MSKKRVIGLVCAFTATLCWASNYLVYRLIFNCGGAEELDEWWSAWLRTSMGALLMLPFSFAVREGGWRKFAGEWKKDWKIFLFLGMFLVLEGVLCFAAAKYTTAARNSLFCNTSPVFTLLISWLCARELLNGRKITGVFMGLAGIVLAAFSRGGDIFSSTEISTMWGDFLALLSGVFWALFTVFGGDASRKYNGAFCTVIYRFCGLFIMLPILFFCDVALDFPLQVWLGLLYVALIPGGLAVWLWSIAQKQVEPGVLGAFGYLSAFLAASSSAILLKEQISMLFIAAFVLILGGMALIIAPVRSRKSEVECC